MFCKKCGRQLSEEMKYCPSCGEQSNFSEREGTQRKIVYEGEIHKCPNCGENLASFMAKCPACGHEVRGGKVSLSVREFAQKLEMLEKERTTSRTGIKEIIVKQTQVDIVDQQKISLIRSYVIPNTIEDIFEFMILASSNINGQRYNDFNSIPESDKAISDAWESKFEQAYEKAELSFGNSPDFNKILKIYEKKRNEIKKWKKKRTVFGIGLVGGILLLVILIWVLVFLLGAI